MTTKRTRYVTVPSRQQQPTFVIDRKKLEMNIDYRRLEQRRLISLEVGEIVNKIRPLLKKLKAMKLDDDGSHWSDSEIVDILGLNTD